MVRLIQYQIVLEREHISVILFGMGSRIAGGISDFDKESVTRWSCRVEIQM